MIFTTEIFFTFLCNVVEKEREKVFEYLATDASLGLVGDPKIISK